MVEEHEFHPLHRIEVIYVVRILGSVLICMKGMDRIVLPTGDPPRPWGGGLSWTSW